MANKPALSEQQETLQTPDGPIEFTLTRKRVRNLNLRIRADGSVHVSAPPRMPRREIDAFLAGKAGWITRHRGQALARPQPAACTVPKAEALALFTPISDAIFPLFSDLLGGVKPTLKVREMKTRWGVCNIKNRCITLNTRLAEKPLPAVEYVILHEYVHFLHANHQSGFHAEMARLMPDYRQRRKLLR